MRRPFQCAPSRAVAAALVMALWLPACGAPGPRPEAPAVDSTDARAYTLMRLAEREERLSAVVRALRVTGLDEALQQGGPYTFFAPTDAALRQSFPALDTLLQARPDSLRTVLRAHLVRGRFRPADVTGSLRVGTLERTSLTLRRTQAQVRVGDHVALGSIEGRNGVLYLLPGVLERTPLDTLR